MNITLKSGKKIIEDKYEPIVQEYFDRMEEHSGSLDAESSDVGTGMIGAPACGDILRLQIKVKDGKIKDAKFKTFGCKAAVSSSVYAVEAIKGKTIEEAKSVTNQQIAENLSLPPVKKHCSILAEGALKKAFEDLASKTESAGNINS